MMLQGIAGSGKLLHREQFCSKVSLTAPQTKCLRRVPVAARQGHNINAAAAEAPILPFSRDAEHLEQWSRTSWRKRKAHQQPEYTNKEKLADAVAEINRMPPLVFAGECRTLQARLAKCAAGESFMLTGGDCAGRILLALREPPSKLTAAWCCQHTCFSHTQPWLVQRLNHLVWRVQRASPNSRQTGSGTPSESCFRCLLS